MPTIAEIARVAGVSEMTVSRVVNGLAQYRRPTFARRAERIRALAARMGYRPSAAARAVRQGRAGCIGLLLSSEGNRSNLPEPLLLAIEQELTARRLRLAVAMLPDEKLTSAGFVPQLLREVAADGLLIDYTDHIPASMVERIRGSGAPAVWMNARLPADCVHPDDRGAGRAAARRLLELGHRRIVFADFSHGAGDAARHYSADDRFAGYAAAMRAAGAAPVRWWSDAGGGVPGAERVPLAHRILSARGRPTAVVAYSHTTAIPFFHAAAGLGLAVPRDLSLVSFDDWPIEYLGPRFTTALVPHAAVGRAAVAMLAERLAGRRRAHRPVAVPFAFEPGATCAPPP